MGFISFLQTVVQFVQQWLCTNGQPMNPVLVHHTSLEVWISQLVFRTHLNPEEVCCNDSAGMNLPERVRARRLR